MARVASPPKLGYAHGGVAQGRGSAIAGHPEPSVLAPHTQPAGVLCHYRELVIKAQWILTGNWGAKSTVSSGSAVKSNHDEKFPGQQWTSTRLTPQATLPGP
jgi:hypothetical protein